ARGDVLEQEAEPHPVPLHGRERDARPHADLANAEPGVAERDDAPEGRPGQRREVDADRRLRGEASSLDRPYTDAIAPVHPQRCRGRAPDGQPEPVALAYPDLDVVRGDVHSDGRPERVDEGGALPDDPEPLVDHDPPRVRAGP